MRRDILSSFEKGLFTPIPMRLSSKVSHVCNVVPLKPSETSSQARGSLVISPHCFRLGLSDT